MITALLDVTKSLSTHYGAIICLHKLGPNVVESFIIPNVSTYAKYLEPIISDGEFQERYDALKVEEAMLVWF